MIGEMLRSTVGWPAGISAVPEKIESGQKEFRIEHDSIGDKEVPADAYYGVQTLRAVENFRITGLNLHPELINCLVEIKKAAAITNCEIGLLAPEISDAIVKACDEILAGNFRLHFVVDPIQGGAGTSLNMNANEVIANRAIELLGGKKGEYNLVHPNDHVNLGQSTNDVIPTAGKMTTIRLLMKLRLMSSGPRAGFGEINLPAMQNGSSIMPGKVNPVIPEVVNQVSFNVIGNDVTITMAAEAGQLELNAFEPIIFYNLFQSIDTLGFATETFVDNCITGITANEERCRELVENSVGIVTTLAPVIGYQRAADIAKKALKQNRPVREIILEEKILDPEELSRILDPVSMTEPGIKH